MRLHAHTKRWQDLFWNELHPYPKMILSYCYDNADSAGFIDYSCSLWLTQMKGKLDSRYPEFTKKDLLNLYKIIILAILKVVILKLNIVKLKKQIYRTF